MLNLPVRVLFAIYFGLVMGLVHLASSESDKTILGQIRSRSDALCFLVIVCLDLGSISTLNLFLKEKQVFIRECQASYYDIFSYYWSRFLIQIAVGIPMSLAIVFIC